MIYIIRHGQTDWNIEGKIQGCTDIPLNETGRKQAKELANKIKSLEIDNFFSSDLLRAKETAKIINEDLKMSITFDKRLREINYGDFEGTLKNNISQEMWDTFNFFPEKLNAEPKEVAFERVKSFFMEFKHIDSNILIVTHGGLLKVMMYYFDNHDLFSNTEYLMKYNRLKINNAEIFEIDL